ncbi:MAG: methyltransferase [Planctomycetota bacterium]|nr:methyltransferase [Planctomycetota bacterium]
MWRRLRERLAKLRERPTHHVPPELPEGATPGALLEALETWRNANAERYARFFLFERPMRVPRADRPLFDQLAEAGLCAHAGASLFRPHVRLFALDGKWIATDCLSHADPDQVFSLMFEQVYLVRTMDIRETDDVLELCVGSGVNSLFAADTAASVTGVDLNPRALRFAAFNRALNGADERLALHEGSLFTPVGDRRFDVVVINPPFELVPEGATWFLHSHGGEDGLDVVRTFLGALPAHLTPEGRMEMITWSPGSAEGPHLLPLIREALPEHHLRVDLLAEGDLDEHVDRFKDHSAYDAFRARLAAKGIDRVHFVYVRASRDQARGVEVRTPIQAITRCHVVADAWI